MRKRWSGLALACSLLAATGAHAQESSGTTFLLSVVDLPLGQNGAVKSFSLKTWGVSFHAICHIPPGWVIGAGGSATPDGELKGDGSLGITWLRSAELPELRSLALVSLSGPVQNDDIRTKDGGLIPATFKGKAVIASGDKFKTAQLTAAHIRLAEAGQCPEISLPASEAE